MMKIMVKYHMGACTTTEQVGNMEIRISKRLENGENQTIIIEGEMNVLGLEPEEVMPFLLDTEILMNETGKVRVWFYDTGIFK